MYSINTCFNHAFHLSKRIGMEQDNYKALLVAANLARYKGGDFMIIVDKWKSFLRGHHFTDLPSDCTPFEFDQKRMVFDRKCQLVYVIRIGGRYAGPPTMSFERQTIHRTLLSLVVAHRRGCVVASSMLSCQPPPAFVIPIAG